MFEPITSRADFPELERRILRFWKERRIFEASVEARRGGARFVFYEGPPTANGSPGIHHVLSRVFKDAIPRYKSMKGYYAPRQAGWDTHGLPVELEVEKEIGLSSKAQIERYGVARFNSRCRESVFRYLREWQDMTERVGAWLDMERPYVTLDNSYIESCWWAVKQLWEKGLIYQGYRVTPHCPRCGTSLSSHEVALGYKDDADDPSVWVKFKLVDTQPGVEAALGDAKRFRAKPAFFLAWTTTPWTLPGNTALAVARDAEYALLEGETEYLILASALVGRVGLEGYKEMAYVSGARLVGLKYEPLFDPFLYQGAEVDPSGGWHQFEVWQLGKGERLRVRPSPGEALNYPIIAAEFVSMEEGTGIVHIAPAFGEVDLQAGEENDLDFVQPVDLEGKITGAYPFSGLFVKDADPHILDDLSSRGLLFRSQRITHTYPFCWRCDTPLLYYAKESWYIRTTAKKDQLMAGNDEISWYPEHIKYGRFGDWLKNNVDWALSRERYWGTPLPIWRCDCGGQECVGSLEELRQKPGLEGWAEPLELHRPFIDQVSFACPGCRGRMQRVPEVLDAWFDSGAMPLARWHYPFENKELFDVSFPADFISEGVDQTRGWFYTLHALSVLLFDRPCFRNVICLGHILDAKGEKMSKARGNVVDPWSVLDKYGADALRWYLFTSSPAGNVRRFSVDQVAEAVRKFLLTLWNTYSFFVTYANIDRFDPSSAATTEPLSDLDRWIVSELNLTVKEVTQAFDSYDPTRAGRRIGDFVDDLSNWYVRRSRRRFWKSESDADKLAAHATLYRCLVTVAKLLAPLTPFVAEEIYRNLVRRAYPQAPESVHLADFPQADEAKIDEALADKMRLAMKISSLGRSARSKAGISVRQPVAPSGVWFESPVEADVFSEIASLAAQEINTKSINVVTVGEIREMLKGPRYVGAEEPGYAFAIDTEITPELAAEGMARELVRRLQTMRRSAGFDIADHIITYYQGEASIARVMHDQADYIRQETLSRELVEGVPEDCYSERHRIGGKEIWLGVKVT